MRSPYRYRIYKFIVIALLLIQCSTPEKKIYTTDDFTTEITYPYRVFRLSSNRNSNGLYIGYPAELLAKAQPINNDTVFDFSIKKKDRLCCIKILDSRLRNFNSDDLTEILLKEFEIKNYSEKVHAYILDCSCYSWKKKDSKDIMLCTTDLLAENIRTQCNKPVVFLNDGRDSIMRIPTDIIGCHSIDDVAKILFDNCNISLYTSDSTYCTKIVYYLIK